MPTPKIEKMYIDDKFNPENKTEYVLFNMIVETRKVLNQLINRDSHNQEGEKCVCGGGDVLFEETKKFLERSSHTKPCPIHDKEEVCEHGTKIVKGVLGCVKCDFPTESSARLGQPTPQEEKEWEQELCKIGNVTKNLSGMDLANIILFVRNLLSTTKQQEQARILRIISDKKGKEYDGRPSCAMTAFNARNELIEDLITEITK